MDEQEQQLHRTWVQLILDNGYRDVAAIAIDCELELKCYWAENFGESYRVDIGITIDVPSEMYVHVKNNEKTKNLMERSLLAVCDGRIEFTDQGKKVKDPVTYRVKLLEVDGEWKNATRSLILGDGISNQGEVTQLMFAKRNKTPYIYNEMRFASQSEIRIAQELESKKVLFFPLPLAVRAETGRFF